MGVGEGEKGTGPGPLKKRANSEKGLKIEHVSEATVGQTKWDLSDLGGGGGSGGGCVDTRTQT